MEADLSQQTAINMTTTSASASGLRPHAWLAQILFQAETLGA